MNFSIFLITLGIIRSIIGAQLNNTDDNVCTIPIFRRKRALTEYTRWRGNVDTTKEFIVKVLEDDLTTPRTQQVVAVNIQPITQHAEKIIIGGAIVPSSTATTTVLQNSKEYTRFVPPTTASRFDANIILPTAVSINDRHFQLQSKGIVKSGVQISPIKYAEIRGPQRDDSPPGSPQFIARTPALLDRQFAPVAPVSFTRRTTGTAIHPPSIVSFVFQKVTSRPTRTSTLTDIVTPVRTKATINFDNFNPYEEIISGNMYNHPLRSTLLSLYDFEKGTNIKKLSDAFSQSVKYLNSTESAFGLRRTNIISETDTDFYHINYDTENEGTLKKGQEANEENHHSKNKALDEKYQDTSEKYSDFSHSLTNEVIDQVEESDNITEIKFKNYADYDEELVNSTLRITLTSIKDVSSLEVTTARTLKRKNIHKNLNCSLVKLRKLNFNSPRTLPEIVSQLKQWAEASPIAKWIDITDGNYTIMENPIYMMIVDDPSSGQIVSAKQTVMIVAGIQGRDHHAVAAAMYVLYQLIERSEAHTDLLTKYRFWIIPVFNPDGYDYSMTFLHRREWTKNLRQYWASCKGRDHCRYCTSHGIGCTIKPCYGVNLDRNFEYQWIPTEELRAEHPCGVLHAGVRQLSEAETRALTYFLHEQRTPLVTFIAFKEGDILGIMYPYSHTRKRRAFDHVYRQRASRAATAAYSISGRPYVAGQTSEFLPLYAGGIEDWVDGHLGIDNTYTVMMFKPSDSYNSKLITERVVHEAYAAMDTLLLQSTEPLGPPQVVLTRARGSAVVAQGFVISVIPSLLLIYWIHEKGYVYNILI